jgi:predicted metal-binding protein
MKDRAKGIVDERAAVLRELCAVAMRGGAADTQVISAGDVIIDPRVRFKCMIAPCNESGSCGHCPPHGHSIQDNRSRLTDYEKAVFFRVAADQRYMSAPDFARCRENGVFDDGGALIRVGMYYILVYQIAALIERRARELGFEPLGFAAGDCKEVLCFFHPGCRALKNRDKCRNPDLSRPSMESAGMDVFAMAANVGWDVYPLGGDSRPGDAPEASLFGLVLVY